MKWIIITAALLAALGIFTIFTVGVAYTIAENTRQTEELK